MFFQLVVKTLVRLKLCLFYRFWYANNGCATRLYKYEHLKTKKFQNRFAKNFDYLLFVYFQSYCSIYCNGRFSVSK